MKFCRRENWHTNSWIGKIRKYIIGLRLIFCHCFYVRALNWNFTVKNTVKESFPLRFSSGNTQKTASLVYLLKKSLILKFLWFLCSWKILTYAFSLNQEWLVHIGDITTFEKERERSIFIFFGAGSIFLSNT